jgi:hypothetical protein
VCANWLALETHVFHAHGAAALAAYVKRRDGQKQLVTQVHQHENGELYTFANTTWRLLHPCPTYVQTQSAPDQHADSRGSLCHGRRSVSFVLAPRDAAFIRLALAMCFNQDDHAHWLTDEDVADMIAHYINRTMVVTFTRAGTCIDISGSIRGTDACRNIAQNRVSGSFTGRSAVCDFPMRTGAHYISMKLGQSTVKPVISDAQPRTRLPRLQGMAVGVVSAEYDPSGPREVSAHVSTSSSGGAFLYAPVNGNLIHSNCGYDWPGQRPAALGDTIGLLLDLDRGSLDIWKNGQWLGTMVNCNPSLRRRVSDYSEHSSDKVQPLHWCCDLGWEASSVEIIRWHR